MLTSESAKKRKIFEQGEENAETNRKLLLLKIRQFEFDERDRTQFIIELKEKERRVVESYEKRVNVQKELLRQKEEQLVQISQAAHFYKEEVSKNMEEIETCTQRAAAKEEVIS